MALPTHYVLMGYIAKFDLNYKNKLSSQTVSMLTDQSWLRITGSNGHLGGLCANKYLLNLHISYY